MEDQVKPVSRPWRRFLRLSVRGLTVLVLVIGAGLGWIIRSAGIQREAVASIRKAGGSVHYHGAMGDNRRWWPNLLMDRLGVDYFDRVERADFLLDACSDAEMVHVGRLSGLVQLTLLALPNAIRGTRITDSGLAQLKGLKSIRRLDLDGTLITDAGLNHLRGLTSLQVLSVGGTKISGAGLAALSGLTELSVLRLGATPVSDAGLAHLKGLTKLSELDLGGTQVTDVGLAHIERLTTLSELDLGGTQVTDVGLVHLQGLTKLAELDLSGTRVTDAGLLHLKGLANLAELGIWDTQVTDAGIKELAQALPTLKIHHLTAQAPTPPPRTVPRRTP